MRNDDGPLFRNSTNGGVADDTPTERSKMAQGKVGLYNSLEWTETTAKGEVQLMIADLPAQGYKVICGQGINESQF